MNVKRFLLTPALILVSCLRTDAATVPVNDYSKQLVGAWAVRTYAYTFQPNGTYSYKPMEGADGMAAITGTWKIKGKKLTLTHSDRPAAFTIGISFLSADTWEWETRPGRVWEVTRISR